MSLCTAIDFQIEDFLANSSGLGLNLSTNNGLDLTCPTYEEGLNLTNQQATQSGGGAQNHGSGHEQGFNYNEPMVLNLTQVSTFLPILMAKISKSNLKLFLFLVRKILNNRYYCLFAASRKPTSVSSSPVKSSSPNYWSKYHAHFTTTSQLFLCFIWPRPE